MLMNTSEHNGQITRCAQVIKLAAVKVLTQTALKVVDKAQQLEEKVVDACVARGPHLLVQVDWEAV